MTGSLFYRQHLPYPAHHHQAGYKTQQAFNAVVHSTTVFVIPFSPNQASQLHPDKIRPEELNGSEWITIKTGIIGRRGQTKRTAATGQRTDGGEGQTDGGEGQTGFVSPIKQHFITGIKLLPHITNKNRYKFQTRSHHSFSTGDRLSASIPRPRSLRQGKRDEFEGNLGWGIG